MSVPGFVFFFIFGLYLLCKFIGWLLKEKPANVIIISKDYLAKDKELVDDMVLLDMQGEDEYTFDLVE